MRGYAGWALRDRSFATALAVSVLWHVFWFVVINVNVAPPRSFVKPDPRMVALGPVLDDTLFSTLARNRPQLSETFYRRLSDYAADTATSVQAGSGRIVALPTVSGNADELRRLLAGPKAEPES